MQKDKLTEALKIPFLMVFLFAFIFGMEKLAHAGHTYLALVPRTWVGLLGILTSPFLHANFGHLVSNTFPFLILGTGIWLFYPQIAARLMMQLYFCTQFGVWLLGRDASHIGASGVVYAFAGFLFFGGMFRKDLKATMISLAVSSLYGGMTVGLFPNEPHISWESHLIGFLMGGFFALFYRNIPDIDNQTPQVQEIVEPIPFEIPQGFRKIEGKGYRYVFIEKRKENPPIHKS